MSNATWYVNSQTSIIRLTVYHPTFYYFLLWGSRPASPDNEPSVHLSIQQQPPTTTDHRRRCHPSDNYQPSVIGRWMRETASNKHHTLHHRPTVVVWQRVCCNTDVTFSDDRRSERRTRETAGRRRSHRTALVMMSCKWWLVEGTMMYGCCCIMMLLFDVSSSATNFNTTTPKAKGGRDWRDWWPMRYLLVLPAGGVFQTEPPGGCLRQALDSDRIVYCQAGGEQRTVDFGTSILTSFLWIRQDSLCL